MDRPPVANSDVTNYSSDHQALNEPTFNEPTLNDSNCDDALGPQDPFLNATILVELYCLPVICIFGLVGNTLSSITFFRNPLRKTSCSLYLAARSISDSGFLLALLLTWISSVFGLRLGSIRGICAAIVFLTYICGCLSVWFVVFLTIENYVRICHPFFIKSVCSKRLARILTCVLCVLSLGIYSTPLWISDSNCSHNYKYHKITEILVYVDTLLTLVIPSILITCFMIAITFKVIKTFRRRQRLRKSSDSKTSSHTKSHPMAKVTKMLFIVSMTFFILNIPSHIIRLYILINSFVRGQSQSPNIERAFQTLFQQLYYLSFSVNIVIYLTFGRNFRTAFMETFCCRRTRDVPCGSSMEAVNLVSNRRLKRQASLPIIPDKDRNGHLELPSSAFLHPASVC